MEMTWPRRDLIATVLVGVATLVYVLWLANVGPGVRPVAAIVLALGFAASAAAVVPAFTDLLHSSKIYLAVTSTLGLLALVAGVIALATGSTAMLATLVITTLALWALATIRHQRTESRPDAASPTQSRTDTAPPARWTVRRARGRSVSCPDVNEGVHDATTHLGPVLGINEPCGIGAGTGPPGVGSQAQVPR